MAVPRILDPHAVPVVGTDAHLPAVDRDAADAGGAAPALRQHRRLAARDPRRRRRSASRKPAPASVLVPLVQRADGLQVLLTRRTEHLRDHAGQISFPGGRGEAADADAVATALRETEEEVGLPRQRVDVIGRLPHYTTVTDYCRHAGRRAGAAAVHAAARQLRGRRGLRGAAELPDDAGASPAPRLRAARASAGSSCRCRGDAPAASGTPRDYFIWGATAAMLRNLYGFLAR